MCGGVGRIVNGCDLLEARPRSGRDTRFMKRKLELRIFQLEITEVETYRRKHRRDWWQSHGSVRFKIIGTFGYVLKYVRNGCFCIVATFIGDECVSLKRMKLVSNNKT